MVALSNIVAFATMLAVVAADLVVLTPGGPDLWWVAKSQNVLGWNCHSSPYANFTVLVGNPTNPSVLPAPIAIISIEQNFQCSQEITQDMSNQPAGTGYTVLLANPLNNSDIFATSKPFEIKPLGSAYPAPSATPTESGASGTASGSGAPSSNTSKASGAASTLKLSAGYGIAAMAALLGLVTA